MKKTHHKKKAWRTHVLVRTIKALINEFGENEVKEAIAKIFPKLTN